MDLVSDILHTARIRGTLYFRTEMGGPWSLRLPPEPNLIRFHIVETGECWVGVYGSEEALRLRTGDMVVIPHGAEQVLSDLPGRTPVPLADVLLETGFEYGEPLRVGPADAANQTSLVCGFCTFDAGVVHPMLAALPAHIVIRGADTVDNAWLSDAIRFLTFEAHTDRPGHKAIADRLADILLVQAMRVHARAVGEEAVFFKALADPQLARALLAIHASPEEQWTVAALAEEAGLSRSRFVELFRAAVGQPPLQYLTDWRMQRARLLLITTRLSVAEIGYRVGYRSLPAFSRRFARSFGIGPGRYRRDYDSGAVADPFVEQLHPS